MIRLIVCQWQMRFSIHLSHCRLTMEVLIESGWMRGKLHDREGVSHLTNRPCFWMKVLFHGRRSTSGPLTATGVWSHFSFPPKGRQGKLRVMNNDNGLGASGERKHGSLQNEKGKVFEGGGNKNILNYMQKTVYKCFIFLLPCKMFSLARL